MEYLIGIDTGTSSTRAILIDEGGHLVYSSTKGYPMYTPKHSWAEQDPEDWSQALIHTIRDIVDNGGIKPEKIACVGLSGQMHGLVALDRSGRPIRNSLIWCDNRAGSQTDTIYDIFGKEEFIKLSYNQALPGYIAPKLLWMEENEPQNYKKIYKVLLPKDYIRYILSGTYASEVSDASGTLLMDIAGRRWSEDLIRGLGIDANILPDIYESTYISSRLSKEAARATGLKQGMPIAGGGGDNAAGAVGTGIIAEGLISDSIGTSGVVFIHTDRPVFDPMGRFHCTCHTVPYKWNLLGATLAAGGSFRWYQQKFGPTEAIRSEFSDLDDYGLLDKQAEKIPAGSQGLLFLPYLIGERTPYADPDARGVLFGLSYLHGPDHMARAILEGVAFSQLDCLDIAKELGIDYDEIIMIGGGSKSALWRQILADITATQVTVNNVTEGPAFGAALIAGTAVGLYRDVFEAHNRTVKKVGKSDPRKKEQKIYQRYYEVYRSLYGTLKQEFKALSRI